MRDPLGSDRRGVMRVVRSGLYLACILLLASLALALYLGDWLSMALCLVAAATVALLFAVVLLWLLVHPSRRKLRFALPAAASLAFTLALAPTFSGLAWPLYLWPRRAELDLLVEDVLAYGRIHEMNDGLRHHKSLNGTRFDSSDQVVESPEFPPLVPVLESEHIGPAKYESFRRRLIEVGFIEVSVTDSYVALVYDGFVGNLHGLLWVRPGSSPPSPGTLVVDTELVSLRDLGGGWFSFTTT